MVSDRDLEKMVGVLSEHFLLREDLFHIVTGPRRETWFTAESIAVLSKEECSELDKGFLITGEQSYTKLLHDSGTIATQEDGLRRIPDIVGFSARCKKAKIAFIIEAKLIDSMKSARKTLHDLFEQLAFAKKMFPTVVVVGFVFLVHHRYNAARDGVFPEKFFQRVTQRIESGFQFPPCHWIVPDKVKVIRRDVEPIGGKWDGAVSLGLASFRVQL